MDLFNSKVHDVFVSTDSCFFVCFVIIDIVRGLCLVRADRRSVPTGPDDTHGLRQTAAVSPSFSGAVNYFVCVLLIYKSVAVYGRLEILITYCMVAPQSKLARSSHSINRHYPQTVVMFLTPPGSLLKRIAHSSSAPKYFFGIAVSWVFTHGLDFRNGHSSEY